MDSLNPRRFDSSRAVLEEAAFYPPARITQLFTLKQLLAEGKVQPEMALLLTEGVTGGLALPTVQLVYHHVAQGNLLEKSWVAAFCSICNGGAVFSPAVDEWLLHFSVRGVYDAMILMGDEETGSYWDHLTGECVHGPLVGKRLNRLSTLLHSTVSKALTTWPEMLVAFAPLNAEQQAEAQEDDAWRQEVAPEWSERLSKTLALEDDRLPRLDMGLGAWTETTRRYYPVSRLNMMENALIDDFDEGRLLVYVDPESRVPDAFYTEAKSLQVRRDVIQLDTGDVLREGGLFSKEGSWKPVKRPLQLFSRWYAFAARFPNCEIYG